MRDVSIALATYAWFAYLLSWPFVLGGTAIAWALAALVAIRRRNHRTALASAAVVLALIAVAILVLAEAEPMLYSVLPQGLGPSAQLAVLGLPALAAIAGVLWLVGSPGAKRDVAARAPRR